MHRGRNRRLLPALVFGLLSLILVGCGGAGVVAEPQYSSPGPANPPERFSEEAYRLGGGDQIRLIVFGEEDLSGEFVVDGEGFVSLPLVGEVRAGGYTLREFEQEVVVALSQGYLRDPRVSAEVLNFRPFYIIGEVEDGGEYPFVQGMTVLNAVAVAGGYTYRADRRRVFITHANASGELEYNTERGAAVLPGDVIRVPERFF